MAPAVLGFVSEGKILEVGGSSKLTRPDQEGVVEKSPGFEIRDQAGCGLVDGEALLGKTLANRFVMVPATRGDLDEAHAGFGKAAGQQALASELVGLFLADAIEIERGL